MIPPPLPGARRVLLVDTGTTWRGGQRQLVLLASGLRTHGWEPLVVAPPRTPLAHELKRAGIATAVLRIRSRLDLLALRRLRRLISTWRPALVHAHDPRSQAVLAAALLVRPHRIPFVVTRRLATRPRGARPSAPRVDRFIAITGAVRDALRAAAVDEARIALVYPGIGLPAGTAPRNWRAECGWDGVPVVAGVVGPLSEARHRAGLDALVTRVARQTRERLALVVLGGPSDGRAEIGGVRAYRTGFVHDVSGALAGLDLLLHPGGAEGLGTAVVEAMALRVPTLGFAAGGIGEIIEHGRNGVLVPTGDDGAFAAALDDLVNADDRRQALGAAGPTRAKAFSADRMVTETEAIYRDLTERPAV